MEKRTQYTHCIYNKIQRHKLVLHTHLMLTELRHDLVKNCEYRARASLVQMRSPQNISETLINTTAIWPVNVCVCVISVKRVLTTRSGEIPDQDNVDDNLVEVVAGERYAKGIPQQHYAAWTFVAYAAWTFVATYFNSVPTKRAVYTRDDDVTSAVWERRRVCERSVHVN